MADLAKAYVQILPSAKGFRSKLKQEIEPGVSDSGEESGASWGKKMLGAIGKLAIGAGIAKIIKEGISQGAALEQAWGGIETLYKDSAGKMKQYAQEAYRTAGVSANEYMENVTSFSASLLQAAGKNTEKTAEIANMAMIDMSDNANKMGTDIASIQNAYQGFAKQNYTMLDNLKLGYGGTKQEMQRLLADAQKLTGVKYDINNLADVYEAIHVIQGELDITGTTAKEASSTFSGSFGAMKAAAVNLLGYMADSKDGWDIGPALNALVETTSTFLFGNAIPMLLSFAAQIPQAIITVFTTAVPILTKQAQTLASKVGEAVKNGGIKNMIDGALGMIRGLVTTFTDNFPMLLQAAADIVGQLVLGILDAAPEILNGAVDLIDSLVTGLLDNSDAIIETGTNLITSLLNGIVDAIPKVIALIPELLTKIVTTITKNLPKLFKIGGALMGALLDGMGKLVASVPEIVAAIWDVIANTDWISLGVMLLSAIWQGIQAFMGAVQSGWTAFWGVIKQLLLAAWNAIKSAVKAALDNVKKSMSDAWNNIKTTATNVWNGIKTTISNVVTGIKTTVQNVFNSLSSAVSTIFSGVKTTVTNIWNGIKSTVSSVVNGIKSTVSSVFNTFGGIISGALSGIKGTVSNVFNSVKSAITGPLETAKNTVKSIVDAIKGFFNFKFQMPHIPKPYFTISPAGWKVGDLLKGSIPHLDVGWKAKAMNNPMLFTDPTIFGMNKNGLLGAGEAGDELMYGHAALLRDIATASRGDDVVMLLAEMVDYISGGRFADSLSKSMTGVHVDINDREFGRLVKRYA